MCDVCCIYSFRYVGGGGSGTAVCQYRYFSLVAWLQNLLQTKAVHDAIMGYGGRLMSLSVASADDGPGDNPTQDLVEDATLADWWDGSECDELRRRHPDFFSNSNNLLLNLTADGFLVHGKTPGKVDKDKEKGKSIWPITVSISNLPPQIRNKLGASAPLGITPMSHFHDIQPFLEPIVDELLLLWHGVSFTMPDDSSQVCCVLLPIRTCIRQ